MMFLVVEGATRSSLRRGVMRSYKGLLRVGTALAVGVALLLPFNGGVSAEGTTGLDLSKLRPELRVTAYPRQERCRVAKGGNGEVNENCLNVSDSNMQGSGEAQNETAIAV